MLGSKAAIEYANDLGPEAIARRVEALADHARQQLAALPGVTAVRRGDATAQSLEQTRATPAGASRPALRVEYDPPRLAYLDLCERVLEEPAASAGQPLVLLAAGTEQELLAAVLLAARDGSASVARLAEVVPAESSPAR